MSLEENQHCSDRIASFAAILQPLVDSGFVGVSEVGRFAELSAEMYDASLEESIWASFCQRHYEGTKYFPKPVLEVKGYRWLYQRWSTSIKREPSILDPPSCGWQDFEIFVHVTYNGKALVSCVGKGLKFMTDLHKGASYIRLPEPIHFGNAEWDFTEAERERYETEYRQEGKPSQGLRIKCQDFDASKVAIKAHMFRKRDSAMCCVYDTQECPLVMRIDYHAHPRVEEGEKITHEADFDLNENAKRVRSTRIQKAINKNDIESLPLKNSVQAATIMEKLAKPFRFVVALTPSVKREKKTFAISKIKVCVMAKDEGSRHFDDFNCAEEKKKHGVTLLHILSELQGS